MLCRDWRADVVRHAAYDEVPPQAVALFARQTRARNSDLTGVSRAPSITSPVIFVGRTGCGSVAGDLRPTGMRLGQCGGEGDAGAGDLCTGRVRRLERRRDGDCGAGAASAAASAAAGGGGDNRRLMVR